MPICRRVPGRCPGAYLRWVCAQCSLQTRPGSASRGRLSVPPLGAAWAFVAGHPVEEGRSEAKELPGHPPCPAQSWHWPISCRVSNWPVLKLPWWDGGRKPTSAGSEHPRDRPESMWRETCRPGASCWSPGDDGPHTVPGPEPPTEAFQEP